MVGERHKAFAEVEDLLFVDRDLAYELLWNFVRTLSSRLREVSPRLTDDAVVWVSYPKADSGAGSDLSREKIRALAGPFGLEPSGSVTLDNIWAALRFVRVAR